jgi:hypothetical protein
MEQQIDPIFMNIYLIQSEESNTEYHFSGVLNADTKYFYLIFLKKHEHCIQGEG